MVRVLWRGKKVVSFEVSFEGVKWWWDSDSSSSRFVEQQGRKHGV